MSVQSENRCESIHKACGVYCNIIIQRMLNETSLSFRDANSGWHLCCYCFKMSRLLSLFLTVLVVMSIGITPIVRGEGYFPFSLKKSPARKDPVGGGSACATCTLITTILLNLAYVHADHLDKFLVSYCTTISEPIKRNLCLDFAEKYGPEIIAQLAYHASPDLACQNLGVCTDPQCALFPNRHFPGQSPWMKGPAESANQSFLTWLENFINVWTGEHLPPIDYDGDRFVGDVKTFRGNYWRGKDCNAINPDIYPGRQVSNDPPEIDYNCNGIFGTNSSSGVSYEKELCANTGARGLIMLGDSATAHFRIPNEWFNATEISWSIWDHLPMVLENEVDWPHRSWGTGHLNDTTGLCSGPLQSIYLQLRERNLCNHRDYQNIGVNGARSTSMAPPGIVTTLARNNATDKPALVFYSLIGNDVCHPEIGFSAYTKPQEFYEKVTDALEYLDTVLPPNSHVVFIGLVDGRILWDTMHNRTHPLGCTYAELYNYLNCLEISPCWGWLNSNGTVRNDTWMWAQQLNLQYQYIMGNESYQNFDMYYHDFPIGEALGIWVSQGGQAYEMIEPVDGFHPSQLANAFVAEILFNDMKRDVPDFLGNINPNNAIIQELFGDQGGY